MSGIIKYAEKALATTKVYSNQGLTYLEAASPEYYKVSADLTKKYTRLAGDFYLVGRNSIIKIYNNTANYVEEKRPVVLASVSRRI